MKTKTPPVKSIDEASSFFHKFESMLGMMKVRDGKKKPPARKPRNKHSGSTFDSFLNEMDIRKSVEIAALEADLKEREARQEAVEWRQVSTSCHQASFLGYTLEAEKYGPDRFWHVYALRKTWSCRPAGQISASTLTKAKLAAIQLAEALDVISRGAK